MMRISATMLFIATPSTNRSITEERQGEGAIVKAETSASGEIFYHFINTVLIAVTVAPPACLFPLLEFFKVRTGICHNSKRSNTFQPSQQAQTVIERTPPFAPKSKNRLHQPPSHPLHPPTSNSHSPPPPPPSPAQDSEPNPSSAPPSS